jgi:hypothetical protein
MFCVFVESVLLRRGVALLWRGEWREWQLAALRRWLF